MFSSRRRHASCSRDWSSDVCSSDLSRPADEPAVALVRTLARQLGGYIANTAMQTGRGQVRSATLEVKVPANRFDEGLSGLAPIGKLESVNVSAEDVGEEFTDATARMANARRLETRLIELIATRTGKLKDVLDVEQELARVRE